MSVKTSIDIKKEPTASHQVIKISQELKESIKIEPIFSQQLPEKSEQEKSALNRKRKSKSSQEIESPVSKKLKINAQTLLKIQSVESLNIKEEIRNENQEILVIKSAVNKKQEFNSLKVPTLKLSRSCKESSWKCLEEILGKSDKKSSKQVTSTKTDPSSSFAASSTSSHNRKKKNKIKNFKPSILKLGTPIFKSLAHQSDSTVHDGIEFVTGTATEIDTVADSEVFEIHDLGGEKRVEIVEFKRNGGKLMEISGKSDENSAGLEENQVKRDEKVMKSAGKTKKSFKEMKVPQNFKTVPESSLKPPAKSSKRSNDPKKPQLPPLKPEKIENPQKSNSTASSCSNSSDTDNSDPESTSDPETPDIHPCINCGMSFKRLSNLKKHKCFFCNDCNKLFSSHQVLTRHISHVHTISNEIFECKDCNKTFKAREYLQTHINSHEKKFVCENCGRKFGNVGRLNCHMIKHNHPDLLTCGVCGLTLSTRSSLKYHMKKHEIVRVKNIKCEVCGFLTDDKRTLRKHMKSHENKKKKYGALVDYVECQKCLARLKNQRSLNNHINYVHTDVTFMCNLCGLVVKTDRNLRRHYQNVHEKDQLN